MDKAFFGQGEGRGRGYLTVGRPQNIPVPHHWATGPLGHWVCVFAVNAIYRPTKKRGSQRPYFHVNQTGVVADGRT